MLAVAALMLNSCSEDNNTMNGVAPVKDSFTEADGQQPVAFDAYMNRATTRAGQSGVLDNTSLQATGFGVIAYYTDDNTYSPNFLPNFMHNTHVEYNANISRWIYEPVRYWPNETGDNAESAGVDRLSFFAYAPWVEVNNRTGIVTDDRENGIVGMIGNTSKGDPLVKYITSFDLSKQVDFTWGVAKTDFTSSADASIQNEIKKDNPYIDVVKPSVGAKIDFNFKHALAALNVQVDADIDVANSHEGSDNHNNGVPAKTKIFVRQISFEGLATKGTFNLNTVNATWYDLTGQNYITHGSATLYDGRLDGHEGTALADSESPANLNPSIIQQYTYEDMAGDDDYWNTKFGMTKPTGFGVTNETVNLFGSGTSGVSTPVYVIPTGQPLRVTIIYDVETENPQLSTFLSDGKTHGVSVEQKITKTVMLGAEPLKLMAGNRYTVNLHLGLTSVNFNARVSESWEAEGISGDLPGNYVPVQSLSLAPAAQVPVSIFLGEGYDDSYEVPFIMSPANGRQ